MNILAYEIGGGYFDYQGLKERAIGDGLVLDLKGL